ncbi:MAG: putative transporter ATP-binding protein [Ilumatobacteraceae bacterium]|nr:putative transporter ATP-binding protein [Ilumatobacteraceae bacterium]
MIEVRGLTKRFGRTTAVNDLSFDVRPGRVTGFLGPNGSGKSTSMRCMLALDRPDSGTAMFDGRPYDTIHDPLFEVGALLDAGYAHPGRNGRNHLRMIASSNGISDTRVDEALALVGLTDAAKRRVGTYSLGMRQRLGLASVLLGDPKVVILDEPANGLDPEGIRWIRDVLVHLAGQGKTVLVSSHLLSEMAQMADDLVVIGLGRLIDTGTVADFVARNARHWVRVRSPQIAQIADQLRSGGATVTMLDDGGIGLTPGIDVIGPTAIEIGELAARNSAILHELSPQQGSLEDAFLEATAGAQEYRSTSPVDNAPPAPSGPVYATPPPQQPPFAPPATNLTNGGQP